MRVDAINSQNDERHRQEKRHEAECLHGGPQNMDQNAPSGDGPCAAHDRTIQDMMKENPAGQFDEQRVNQKCYRGVGKRKITVGNIAERNAVGIFQDVAEVPKDGEPCILPRHNSGGPEKQEHGGRPIPLRPMFMARTLIGGFERVHWSLFL